MLRKVEKNIRTHGCENKKDAGKAVGVGWLEGAEKGEESTKTQLCSKIL